MAHPDQRISARIQRRLAYTRHNARQKKRLAVEQKFVAQAEPVVQSGLFTGMRYIPEAHCSTLSPKLLGSYEAELQPFLASIEDGQFERIYDIGAAEGYYAVGLARRLTKTEIVAYELETETAEALKRLAALNGVEHRIRIEGGATPEALAREAIDGQLLIVDCEGYEDVLLDLDLVPALAGATMLVEIHDMFVPGLTERLCARFERTHDIERIHPQPRDPHAYPGLAGYGAGEQRLLLDEARAPTRETWCFGLFRPKR